jgi:hypothetical protein
MEAVDTAENQKLLVIDAKKEQGSRFVWLNKTIHSGMK